MVGGGDTAMEEANFLTRSPPRSRWSIAARSCARRRSCRTRAEEPEDWVRLGLRDRRDLRRAEGRRQRRQAEDPENRQGHRDETAAAFVAIGHEPNTALFKGQLDMDELGYLKVKPGSRTRISPACSHAATLSIASIGKPSPPRAPDAWRRSTPNAGSKPRANSEQHSSPAFLDSLLQRRVGRVRVQDQTARRECLIAPHFRRILSPAPGKHYAVRKSPIQRVDNPPRRARRSAVRCDLMRHSFAGARASQNSTAHQGADRLPFHRFKLRLSATFLLQF